MVESIRESGLRAELKENAVNWGGLKDAGNMGQFEQHQRDKNSKTAINNYESKHLVHPTEGDTEGKPGKFVPREAATHGAAAIVTLVVASYKTWKQQAFWSSTYFNPSHQPFI